MPRTRNRKAEGAERLAILYEDDWVIAVAKPPGLLAVPAPHERKTSAWSLLTEYLGRKRQRAFTVHRIDRFASGILLFAKNAQARDMLVEQFLAHRPSREYLVVVRGRLENSIATLVHFFRRVGMRQELCAPRTPGAARAELDYKVERPLRNATLVHVSLITGLQNQIRAQFAAIGHPVIGDRKYHAAEAQERRINRVALHATRLLFEHPRTGDVVTVECPPPPDFLSLVSGLAKRGSAR